MFNTFVIICAIFAVFMAVNLVVKAADIRRAAEEAENSLRNISSNLSQMNMDIQGCMRHRNGQDRENTARIIASVEGVKSAVEGARQSSDGVKAAVDGLNRSSCENVNRYIDFIRSLTPEERSDGGQPGSDPTPEQETLLVEGNTQSELKEGEVIADIVDETPSNDAE